MRARSTGRAEAVEVTYDPAKVSYEALLSYFWRHVDPTVKDRQFCDIGSPYHQDYYRKNPLRYRYYRSSCGRDARLQQLWGPSAQR